MFNVIEIIVADIRGESSFDELSPMSTAASSDDENVTRFFSSTNVGRKRKNGAAAGGDDDNPRGLASNKRHLTELVSMESFGRLK